ncbi:hypothetical protein PLESTM_001599400 [Pleodorina starrii]|nr:hypothetical protein PLESTM_001599400 [Pleodorina starrii]
MRRRLVRNDQGENAAKPQLVDDLLDGIASLGLGTAAPRPGPGGAVQAAAIRASAGSVSASEDDAADSSSEADNDANDKDNDNDEDDGPFFERLAPSVLATAAAAAGSSAPQPGSLVLGEQKQYVLAPAVAQKLYPHQVQGVTWLWNLFAMQRGGILGDDMGLGKTMQCSAFLAGLFSSQLIRRAIIIAPKTLIPHWIRELGVCGLRNLTCEFAGSDSERSAALRKAVGGRGIIVTTYGMVQHNSEQLARPAQSRGDRAFTWDVMFLDEGHKIKNPKMKLVEHLHKLPARVRVIISGTPIQNNLMEMHSLFDFSTPGLLSDAKTFKKNYERPITKGLDKEASARERQTGAAIAAELRQRVEPFFLRREKKEVLTSSACSASGPSTSSGSAAGSASQVGQSARALPRKNDLVVWLRLTPLQRKIYTAFLHTDSVRQVLNEKASPLAAITVLKKICDHPALLSQRAANGVISGAHRWAKHGRGANRGGGARLDGRRRETDDLEDFIVYSDEEDETDEGYNSSDEEPTSSGGDVDDLPAEWLGDAASMDSQLHRELEQRGAEASCKTAFVLKLLERLHAEDHRTLIFSQSKVMLNILEAGVKAMKLSYCRIDGDVSTAEERQAHVQRFQTSNIPVFLLSSQVGGLGLTLTAADRVIIVDPAWNPSVDDQSVDRAYRMGQTRDVVVYRLITCGTVEEKIYRRQVFKGGLFKTGTEEGIQFRYFTQTELRDLFAVTTEGLEQSTTQEQLHEMHTHQRNASEETRRHLEQLQKMDAVAGLHDHNLLFTQRPAEQAPSAQEGAAILSQMSGAGLVGVDAITNMLGSGLKLGGRVEDTKRQATLSHLQNEIADLTSRIRSSEFTISTGQCDRMPDRGAKIKESLREMRDRRDALLKSKTEITVLENRASGSTTQPSQPQPSRPQPSQPQPSQPSQSQPRPPAGQIGRRVFGGGLVSRSTGGSRASTDSAGASSGAAPSQGPEQENDGAAPRVEQHQQRVAAPSYSGGYTSSGGGISAATVGEGVPVHIAFDADEVVSFRTASDGTGARNVDDDATSNVIDLTDTP